MIIQLSPENHLLSQARRLAEQYDEKIYLLTTGCFDNSDDKRITFLGYASTKTYGEQTLGPSSFVEELERLHLPHSLEVIDLVGCEQGMRDNKSSYAEEVAKLLHQKGYNIRVNAFTSDEALHNPESVEKRQQGLQDENDRLYREIKEIRESHKGKTPETKPRGEEKKPADGSYGDIMGQLKQLQTSFSPMLDPSLSESDPEISKRFQTISLNNALLKLGGRNHSGEQLAATQDLRKTFDATPAYQFPPDKHLQNMPPESQLTLRIVSQRITELKDERSGFHPLASFKLGRLEALRARLIQTPEKAEQLLTRALRSWQLARGKTGEALKKALESFPAVENSPKANKHAEF